jgi:hypothetical protein
VSGHDAALNTIATNEAGCRSARHPNLKDNEDDDQRKPNDEFGTAKRRVTSWRMIAELRRERKHGSKTIRSNA